MCKLRSIILVGVIAAIAHSVRADIESPAPNSDKADDETGVEVEDVEANGFVAPSPDQMVRFEASDAITEASTIAPELELDENAKRALELYQSAVTLLTSSSSKKKLAFEIMREVSCEHEP
jgi:hypothetical protein